MTYFVITVFFAIFLPQQLISFSAYWNVPSEICWKKLHMNFSLQEYGIVANENYSLNGDEVVIFYEHKFGLYPYFKNYNLSQPINGGLPQNCNISNHLEEVKKNITTLIPNVNFSGLAVIDIEEWRPLFEQHRGNVKVIYINASIDLVKARKSDLNETEAEKLAEAEFNTAAKEFIVKTMELAKSMRPKARWGLYGFPYCNYDAGTEDDNYNCSNKYKGFNDKMQYIYNQSTALYPSIYYGFNASAERRYRYVHAILNETQRVAKNFSRSLPIFVYSKFEYHPRKELESFYNESDQCSTIKQSTDMGADGLIFWSSSANMEKRCDFISQFINSSLGPVTRLSIEQQNKCQVKKCSGEGKCVLKNSTRIMSYVHEPTHSCLSGDPNDYHDYECVEQADKVKQV